MPGIVFKGKVLERLIRAGEPESAGCETTRLTCDLVFDAAWRGGLEARHFG